MNSPTGQLTAMTGQLNTSENMGSDQELGKRNNNPLNIRYNKANNWKGQTGQNKGFCVFDGMVNGIRAGYRLMKNYHKQGYNTIGKIVNRWAPPTENNTRSYIEFVARETGIEETAELQFTPLIYDKIIVAMCKIESRYTPTKTELLQAFSTI